MTHLQNKLKNQRADPFLTYLKIKTKQRTKLTSSLASTLADPSSYLEPSTKSSPMQCLSLTCLFALATLDHSFGATTLTKKKKKEEKNREKIERARMTSSPPLTSLRAPIWTLKVAVAWMGQITEIKTWMVFELVGREVPKFKYIM